MESIVDTININDVFGVIHEGSIYNFEGLIVDLREFNLQNVPDYYDILSGLKSKLRFSKLCIVPSNGTLIVADTTPPTGFQTELNTSDVSELINLFIKQQRLILNEVDEVFILSESPEESFAQPSALEDEFSEQAYNFKISEEEMIQVSNCKPAIYKAIIAEKQNKPSDTTLVKKNNSTCNILRKIDVPTLNRLLTSVELSMLAEKVLDDDYIKAVDYYENSISTNEYNVLARMNLGCVLAQRGNLKEAMIHLEKAQEIDPENPRIANNLDELKKDFENQITPKVEAYKQKYYESGELKCEFKFFDGKRDGITREYYKGGELKAEWVYDTNVLIDGCRGYYRSGELRCEYNYKNGKRNGVTKEYYKSGTLKAEWIYDNDVLVSGCKGYYDTGELQYEYNFENGKRNGITKEFDKNGKLKAEWIYKDDELQQ